VDLGDHEEQGAARIRASAGQGCGGRGTKKASALLSCKGTIYPGNPSSAHQISKSPVMDFAYSVAPRGAVAIEERAAVLLVIVRQGCAHLGTFAPIQHEYRTVVREIRLPRDPMSKPPLCFACST
jgi:hypothetical protein